MSINRKFDRRVNIRMRATDRRIIWYAIGTALVANAVFFGLFSYRRPVRRGGEEGDAVTMISASDFRDAGARKGFRNWLNYHDPRNFGDCGFAPEVVGGVLYDVRPPRRKTPPKPSVAAWSAPVAEFREVPARVLPGRTLLPPPPRSDDGISAAPAAGRVTDGDGRVLPIGDLRLPARTARTVERTVLRVFKDGGSPVLLVHSPCGDDRLDGFAVRALRFLAVREPVPEYVIVEWPEEKK